MAPLSDESRRSLVPGFLYSSNNKALSPLARNNSFGLPMRPTTSSLVPKASRTNNNFMIPAPSEKIAMFSPAYYGACTVGGILSCGLTHMTVTPLDLVKCNMQVILMDQGTTNGNNTSQYFSIFFTFLCHPFFGNLKLGGMEKINHDQLPKYN